MIFRLYWGSLCRGFRSRYTVSRLLAPFSSSRSLQLSRRLSFIWEDTRTREHTHWRALAQARLEPLPRPDARHRGTWVLPTQELGGWLGLKPPPAPRGAFRPLLVHLVTFQQGCRWKGTCTCPELGRVASTGANPNQDRQRRDAVALTVALAPSLSKELKWVWGALFSQSFLRTCDITCFGKSRFPPPRARPLWRNGSLLLS